MGIYVDIRSKKYGYTVANGKYGVGFAILMFSRYEKKKNKFFFVANGDEAIQNIDKYLNYIQANMNNKNEDALLQIEASLYNTRGKLDENDAYYMDYSEVWGCSVKNPDYNPMRPVIEMVEKIDDAIYGYNRFGIKDNLETTMMRSYIGTISSAFHVSSIVKDIGSHYAYTVSIHETDYDKQYLPCILLHNPIDSDDNWQVDEYYMRKLFMTLKKEGLEFEMMECGKNTAYIVIDKQYQKTWAATKPFVTASYQLTTTYPIHYLLQNTASEREKFYCYAKMNGTKLQSVIIDDVELINLPDDEIQKVIGKPVELDSIRYSDIAMFNM